MAMMTFKNDDDAWETQLSVDVPTCFVFYAIIAIFLMIIALIVKLLWNVDGDNGGGEEATATENSTLLFPKDQQVLYSSYGTSEEDLESGKGSCSSSSEDLYDGNICVICYDDQRSCFFIPCGHCVTCYNCSKRIISEEIKTCPICRTFIKKVSKLHIL
ncbi:hypothetical protein Pfo_008628 [Paulownia fortunei]|nr:hypothetical protein Pfo_008628 [Paulownia fortunei]